MPITSINDANDVLKVSLFTPGLRGWGIPLLAWGLPGVGKTHIISDFCRQHDLPLYVMSPGEMGEAAFGVVPVPEGSGPDMVVRFPPPGDLVDRFNTKSKRGVIFTDELTTAPKAAKPGMLSLLLEKRLGGYPFHDNVRVIAAANPPEIAASGTDLTIPEANRVVHVQWQMADIESWTQHMFSALAGSTAPTATDPQTIEDMVMAQWNDIFPQWIGKASGFLQQPSARKFFHAMPDKGQARTRAWSSPRSWSMGIRVMAGSQIHKLSDELSEELLAGAIGDQTAAAFMAWCRDKDLPDAIEVLTGKIKWTPNSKRPDITYAVSLGMAAHIVGKHKVAKTSEEKKDVQHLLGQLFSITNAWTSVREITAVAGRTIIESGLSIGEAGEAGRTWLRAHSEVLKATRAVQNAR